MIFWVLGIGLIYIVAIIANALIIGAVAGLILIAYLLVNVSFKLVGYIKAGGVTNGKE